MQSVGGGCLVMDDQLYFYCSGRNSGRTADDGSGASTGLAILRRDGFASMDADDTVGTLTTRPLRSNGGHLFANVDLSGKEGSELRAEMLDAETGEVIDGFSANDCRPIIADSTRAVLSWKIGTDLAILKNRPLRIRFHLRGGSLYAFWVSSDVSGASQGYVAGGGIGFTGSRDTVGGGANRPE